MLLPGQNDEKTRLCCEVTLHCVSKVWMLASVKVWMLASVKLQILCYEMLYLKHGGKHAECYNENPIKVQEYNLSEHKGFI